MAYHLNWDLESISGLEHDDRIRIVRGVAALSGPAK